MLGHVPATGPTNARLHGLRASGQSELEERVTATTLGTCRADRSAGRQLRTLQRGHSFYRLDQKCRQLPFPITATALAKTKFGELTR